MIFKLKNEKMITFTPNSVVFTFLLSVIFTLSTCTKEDPPEMIPQTKASFDVSNNNCIAPCEVGFTNKSQNAQSFSWNFGDGTTSTDKDPSHTYDEDGSYQVTLTASGNQGNNLTQATVTIRPNPNPHIGNWTLTAGTYNNSPIADITASVNFKDAGEFVAQFEIGSCVGYARAQYSITGQTINSNLPDQLLLNGASGGSNSGGSYYTSISCTQATFLKYGVTALIWTPEDDIQFEMDENTLTLTSSDNKTILMYERD